MLHASTLTTAEQLESLSGEWHDLVERCHGLLPFQLPEWLIVWWASFRQDSRLIHDSLRVQVVRTGSGTLVGIVPLMLTERPHSGPLRARGLSLLGADPYLTELRAPIIDPACERPVAEVLVRHLVEQPGWDWISWAGLNRASAFSQVLGRGLRLQWGAVENANVLTLEPTWEAFKSGLKRNIKESLRHGYNGLRRDELSARLVVASSVAEVDSALGHFFRLHALRSQDQAMRQHRDRFASDRRRDFLRTVCARLAQRGSAKVFLLYVGEEVVAARVGFVLPGCLYLYYSGFDPRWSRYGVMTTAVAEIIKYAIDRGLPRLHLSMGADASKERWGPAVSEFHEAVAVRPGRSSSAAYQLYANTSGHLDLRRVLRRVLPTRQFD